MNIISGKIQKRHQFGIDLRYHYILKLRRHNTIFIYRICWKSKNFKTKEYLLVNVLESLQEILQLMQK